MSDSDALLAAIRRDFPAIMPSQDKAWSRPIALRVIDCVLSLNRNYDRFVVPRLEAFESRFPQIRTVNDLRRFVSTYESPIAFLRDCLNYKDPARSLTLTGVIDFLLRVAVLAPSRSEEESLRLSRIGLLARP